MGMSGTAAPAASPSPSAPPTLDPSSLATSQRASLSPTPQHPLSRSNRTRPATGPPSFQQPWLQSLSQPGSVITHQQLTKPLQKTVPMPPRALPTTLAIAHAVHTLPQSTVPAAFPLLSQTLNNSIRYVDTPSSPKRKRVPKHKKAKAVEEEETRSVFSQQVLAHVNSTATSQAAPCTIGRLGAGVCILSPSPYLSLFLHCSLSPSFSYSHSLFFFLIISTFCLKILFSGITHTYIYIYTTLSPLRFMVILSFHFKYLLFCTVSQPHAF